MGVNSGNEKRGPNPAFIPHATRNSRVAHLPMVPPPDPHGTLTAIKDRELAAQRLRDMGPASARLMYDGHPFSWGEKRAGASQSKKDKKNERTAHEKKATKLAKKR